MGYMTDERRMIQETARAFVMKEVLPVANRLDPEKGDIPPELIQKLADMGYFGIVIPEQYGGLGLGVFEYCLITEELARGWMSVASIIARGNGLSAGSRHDRGPAGGLPAARRPRRISGRRRHVRTQRRLGPAAASPAAPRSDGDDWVITGNKYWCTFADGADYIMLVARTVRRARPKRKHVGLSSFMIEKPRGTLPPGVQRRAHSQDRLFRLEDLGTGLRRVPRCRARHLIGEEGRAFYYISAGPRTRPRPHRRARHRPRPRRARGRHRLCAGAASVRPGDRAISRRSASRSPAWRPRSRRRASSCTSSATRSTSGGAATRKPRW